METPEKYLITAGGKITCLRCTAMSKTTRQQCRKPALKISKTAKCQFHGGRGSGPKTPEGKARIGAAHLVHGNQTNQRRLERSQGSLRMAELEDVLHAAGMTSAARTAGRKPAGYWPIRTMEDVQRWVIEGAVRWRKAVKDGA